MKKYVKVYLDYFGYCEQDFIPCEKCGCRAVDVHHVNKRSAGGKDEIDNLIGLCRECHDKAELKTKPYITEEELKQIIKER